MSEATLSHRTRNLPVFIGTSAATSSSMLVADMVAGIVTVSGVTSTHSIAVYGSSDNVTFAPLYGHDGQAATMAVPAEGGACVMPDAIYPTHYIKRVADSNLGTAASVMVSLKS